MLDIRKLKPGMVIPPHTIACLTATPQSSSNFEEVAVYLGKELIKKIDNVENVRYIRSGKYKGGILLYSSYLPVAFK